MKAERKIRVLLLANEFSSAQIALDEGHAITGMEILPVGSREEFLSQMAQRAPEAVVVESGGIPGLPLREVLELVSETRPRVAVIALGEDGEDGRDVLRYFEEGITDYLPLPQVGRLSQVIHRLRHEQDLEHSQQELREEVRQAQEALLENQKLMSIGRLAASISHEINNPLESITNLLFLLRAEPNLSERAENYVELAEKEMDRVAQISKQTLNFYRETRTPVRIRPSDLLEEVLVLYSRRIQERRMQVIREYMTDETLLVYPGEMRQVLSNLVANAIEATPAGGKITLRTRRARKWSDEGIDGLRIVVADNGSGIAAETRQHLGQLFYTTKGQRGTGLGLWVTRAIVQRYGGEIQLYSSTRPDHHGTVFSIFMPTNMRPQRVLRDGESPRGEEGLRFEKNRLAARDLSTSAIHETGPEKALACSFRARSVPGVAS
ncbi:Two-component sensor histidine kinase [Acidisarcina polymorpha]|uniref:histidine kinase n=2 Tax=Acidisarcina polymorpha TaxID=2211140 RepID=A0A2Z5FXW1_9BACT|nr:Two-component sensor histidine kinase [Acidisarcina polymorpha]